MHKTSQKVVGGNEYLAQDKRTYAINQLNDEVLRQLHIRNIYIYIYVYIYIYIYTRTCTCPVYKAKSKLLNVFV